MRFVLVTCPCTHSNLGRNQLNNSQSFATRYYQDRIENFLNTNSLLCRNISESTHCSRNSFFNCICMGKKNFPFVSWECKLQHAVIYCISEIYLASHSHMHAAAFGCHLDHIYLFRFLFQRINANYILFFFGYSLCISCVFVLLAYFGSLAHLVVHTLNMHCSQFRASCCTEIWTRKRKPKPSSSLQFTPQIPECGFNSIVVC